MTEPELKDIPAIKMVKDLFELNPTVLDLESDELEDGVDPGNSKVIRHRFFRGCEAAPFIASSDRFQSLNAWYLSEAAFLAYTEAATPEMVASKITPPLRRLFSVLQARDGRASVTPTVKVLIVEGDKIETVKDPIQCYVVDDGVVGIVAFRGTLPASIPNWLTDFDLSFTSWRGALGVEVHRGFAHAALALLDGAGGEPGLRTYLKQRLQEFPGLKLWFTGHSLGAALATLAAYDIGSVQALYTYGSPRVGNVGFARMFAQSGVPHYRVVHHHDIVTQVPVAIPIVGYEHVGDLKYIEYEDAGATQPSTGGNPRAKVFDGLPRGRQLASLFSGFQGAAVLDTLGHLRLGFLTRKIDVLTDHAPLYYSNLLWNSFVKMRARMLGLAETPR